MQSELQLVSVISVIKKLEEGIESERRILQLMNDKDEVEGALKEASREKELGEKIYEVSRKFISLIAAVVITRKLTAINNEEKELADRLRCRLNLYREFEEDSGLDVEGESDFLSSPHKQERDTRNLRKGEIKKNVDLQKCRSANVIAGEAVSDVQSSIAQKSKVTAQLRGESTEQIQLIFDTNRRLKRSILDAAARDEEYSVMNEV